MPDVFLQQQFGRCLFPAELGKPVMALLEKF
jgi:hypothetical protein